jgi:hypothetical protein
MMPPDITMGASEWAIIIGDTGEGGRTQMIGGDTYALWDQGCIEDD